MRIYELGRRPLWRIIIVGVVVMLAAQSAAAQDGEEERNKALARRFYEQVWFSHHPEVVNELVAPEYVAHDIGDRKGVAELAAEQARIADFFWQHGTMRGSIDFQIAEGDLVATRWQWEYSPETWWMKVLQLGGQASVPVINVFRFRDGQIVEIWNHRHDIDVGFPGNIFRAQGFVLGLVVAAVVGVGRRRMKRRKAAVSREGTL